MPFFLNQFTPILAAKEPLYNALQCEFRRAWAALCVVFIANSQTKKLKKDTVARPFQWSHHSAAQVTHAVAALRVLLALTFCTACSALSAEPIFLYTVKAGDELIKMSEVAFSSPDGWKEVVTLNKLKKPDAIQPGQILKIPYRLMKPTAVNAVLSSAAGDVQLDGKKVAAGAPVPEGSKLQTGKNSSAVMALADGSKITLLPNTLAELATSRSAGLRGEATAGGDANFFTGLLRLSSGVVQTMAAKNVKRDSPLQIQTPTSLIGVRGTHFRVAYDDPASQNARTEVLQGSVRADNPAQNNGADLVGGKGTVFNAAVQTVSVVDLPKAPDLTQLPVLIFKPQALWPMPIATGYKAFRVQIAGDSGFEKIVRDVLVKGDNAAFADLPNGQWHARVRNVRSDSIEGYDSAVVVQVVLPAEPSQPARQWAITANTLEAVDGKQILRFDHAGLDNSHAIVVSARLARPPFTRIGKAVFKGDTQGIGLELGELQPNELLELSATVAQQDGAVVFAVDYTFTALAAVGRADGLLKRVTQPTGAVTSAVQTKAEAAEEAVQRAQELASAAKVDKAQRENPPTGTASQKMGSGKTAASTSTSTSTRARANPKSLNAPTAPALAAPDNKPRKNPSQRPVAQ